MTGPTFLAGDRTAVIHDSADDRAYDDPGKKCGKKPPPGSHPCSDTNRDPIVAPRGCNQAGAVFPHPSLARADGTVRESFNRTIASTASYFFRQAGQVATGNPAVFARCVSVQR
jgi:hypothetical protein